MIIATIISNSSTTLRTDSGWAVGGLKTRGKSRRSVFSGADFRPSRALLGRGWGWLTDDRKHEWSAMVMALPGKSCLQYQVLNLNKHQLIILLRL